MCQVVGAEETTTAGGGRCVRVTGLACERFVVSRVVCDGYSSLGSGEERESTRRRYIVAECEPYVDEGGEAAAVAEAEERLWRRIRERGGTRYGVRQGRLAKEEEVRRHAHAHAHKHTHTHTHGGHRVCFFLTTFHPAPSSYLVPKDGFDDERDLAVRRFAPGVEEAPAEAGGEKVRGSGRTGASLPRARPRFPRTAPFFVFF